MEGPDPADVLRALGAAAPERAERVAGGMDTALWQVEVGGRAFALRLFRAEQAAVAEREVAALAGAAPRSDALLHLDFHPLNVLVDGRRVTAVIDWANARAGDPRADLARTLTILRLSPVPPRFARLVGVLVAGWRGGYEAEA